MKSQVSCRKPYNHSLHICFIWKTWISLCGLHHDFCASAVWSHTSNLFYFIDSATGLEAIKQANTEQAMIWHVLFFFPAKLLNAFFYLWHVFPPNFKIYLCFPENVFVSSLRCICLFFEMYFPQILKGVCVFLEMYLYLL